ALRERSASHGLRTELPEEPKPETVEQVAEPPKPAPRARREPPLVSEVADTEDSTRLDDLERRVIKLGNAFSEFSAELRFALGYIRTDAASSLTKSRVILERLSLRIYRAEMGRDPRRPLLGDLLNDNQFTRKFERRILSRMNAIRELGNL